MAFCSILKQVFVLALGYTLVHGNEAFPCEDSLSTPTSPDVDNPLMQFDAYPQHHLHGPIKITFQRLSARECAQLCLQVAEENMYNCSSFEHVTNTSDCVLMESSCREGKLLVDSSISFYQSKDHKFSNSCETFSSSSSVSTSLPMSLIEPTVSSIYSQPAASSVVADRHLSGDSSIRINITVVLTNESWHISLENKSSDEFLRLSSRIKQSVANLLDNQSSLLDVLVVRFRNESGLVGEFSVIFSQNVHMRQMNRLYVALHELKHLDSIPVNIISDTVAGKPPKIMNASFTSPTVLHLSWSLGETQQLISTWGLRIVYKSDGDNNTNSVVVNNKQTDLNITGLPSETMVTIWSEAVTSRGFGSPSRVINIATPRQDTRDIVINVTVVLVNISWDAEFANRSSSAFVNLSSVIDNSVTRLHQNESSYKNVSRLQLRNHSLGTVADITVLYDHSIRVDDFFTLYTALYKKKEIGGLMVKVLDDNIPGKPPSNISSVALTSSSILTHWNIPWSNHCELFQSVGFRVSYTLSSKENATLTRYVDTNASTSHVVIKDLDKFEYYELWLQRITSRGLGPASERVTIRTLEEVVSVTVTMRLKEHWVESLLNRTGGAFANLSQEIENNVYLIYENDVHLQRVVCHNFMNDSGKVMAEIELTFGQHVQMYVFTRLHRALYRNGTLGNMTVTPVSDNIPGKLPANITLEATSPTSILIRWESSNTTGNPVVPSLGFRVFYELYLNQENTSTIHSEESNITEGFHMLRNLEKFAEYIVWVRAVTSLGLGVESERIQMRTLEEVVSVNASVRLINEEWVDDLSNATTDSFIYLSENVTRSLEFLYHNDSHFRSVVFHQFKNDSGNVTADLEIKFGQHVVMQLFAILYEALYRNGTFGDVSMEPLWDNIPGKPPTNIAAVATSTTSMRIQWNTPPPSSDVSYIWVFYAVTSNENVTITRINVSKTENSVDIANLGKFVNYTVWLQSVGGRGPGISSAPLYVRTLEEVVPLDLTVRLDGMQWSVNLSDPTSPSFKNLSRQIQENVMVLYGAQSNYIRDVQCHRFKNGSVLADLTIVYGQNVEAQQFATIYKALYKDGKLGNLSVQPVNDSVPGKPPININAIANSSTSIQVTWECADCHQHNATIGCLVSYKLEGTNQTTAFVVNRTTRNYLITGLQKFANYTIQLTSVTTRGIGVTSDKVPSRTLEDVPSLPPFNLHSHNTSSTSLRVIWELIPSDRVHGILLGYLVIYKKHGEINSTRGNTTTMQNSTELTRLEKFTVYDVTVTAFTRVGNGPEANVTASTDQDVPSLPPTDIRAHNTSSTSVLVTWNPVPRGFTHGIVLGYLVLYKRVKDANSTFTNVTSRSSPVELTSLDKYTIYVVKVLAFTVKGNGVESNGSTVRTHEDVPSLPPTDLTAHNTSSTSLRITWQPVPEGHVHGVLQGYRVVFQEQGGSSYRNVTTTNQSLELQALEKFTVYSVKVLAFTVIGDGNVSEPVSVSTDEDVPSLPPQTVTSHNTSSTSLHVSWHDVPLGFVHGILLGYRVFYKIASGTGTANYSIATTTESTRQKELLGLEKFTFYELTVLAFTRIGDGANSTRILVSTDEDIPSQPPAGLAARNTSSTSILVTWGEVPRGFVHGILQGYRVFHKKSRDANGSYVNETTGPTERELHVTALEKYTEYAVKVLAFTRKGDGAVSVNVSVVTDEDVPSLPPQTVQSYNTSSTSVNVTWLEVPDGFVHGVLLGYRVFYSRTKDSGANVMQSVVSHSTRHVQLTGLDKFTNYSIQVAGFTRIGFGAKSPTKRVSTDEDVPSLPPQNVLANNISSTALRITWDPVPRGFVHGILRGYRVLYRKTSEPSASFTVTTVAPGVRAKEIYNLKKYTNYTIRVLAFTIKGDGASSQPVMVSTDEDIPSEKPQNVYAKDRASATVIYMWWQRPPDHTIHGILRGYYIWYSITKLGIHEREPVFPWDYERKQMAAYSENAELTGLESYARYDIRIAAFTSKGYGPIRKISTRTCRCHSTIPTNWWHNPPYVISHAKSNSSERGGIILTVVQDIVQHCCRKCEEFGSATADFTTDAEGLNAEKPGVIQVKDSISTKSMISFAIAGVMEQQIYHSPDGDAEYVAIMETPGVAFVVADKRDIHKEVLMAILSCWPPVLFAVIMTYLAGVVIWALDMNFNPTDFPGSFISGSMEGFWWSFVTMTTVGYGDRIPKSIIARIFGIMWTWAGIATIAVITSSVTASLMSMVFKPEKMLYGTKLAAIANSTEYKLGLRRNAIFESDRVYGNLDEIYDDLKYDRVHAALLDSYSTASESKRFSSSWLRVIEIIPIRYHSANGLVLSGDVMKLARCFHRYVSSERDNIHRIIQKNVGSIEADDVPFAVKTSSDLLTEESYVYQKSVLILGSAFGLFTVMGLLWHFCYRTTKIPTHSSSSTPLDVELEAVAPIEPQLSRAELREQLKHEVKQFHDTFRKKCVALRQKHIKQLKELRKLTNNKSDNAPKQIARLEFPTSRRGHYEVTRPMDVDSIFEGMDLTIFDKTDVRKWPR